MCMCSHSTHSTHLQMGSSSYTPVVVDRHVLRSLHRNQVFVKRFGQPMGNQYFYNVLPDVPISMCPNCFQVHCHSRKGSGVFVVGHLSCWSTRYKLVCYCVLVMEVARPAELNVERTAFGQSSTPICHFFNQCSSSFHLSLASSGAQVYRMKPMMGRVNCVDWRNDFLCASQCVMWFYPSFTDVS